MAPRSSKRESRLLDPFLSLEVFSGYSGLMGGILLFAPRRLLPSFGVRDPVTSATFMLGFVLLASSFYYVASGLGRDRAFARLTVFTRLASPVVTATLFMTGNAPSTFVLLGLVDSAGGVWTWLCLRHTGRAPVTGPPVARPA